MSLRKKVVGGIKWTFVGTIGRSVFQLLQISILTRFLPKEAFGLVAMALVVIQFSNIFIDLGFTSAILHRQNATRNEYSSIYWLNIFISVVLYILLFLTTPLVSVFYNQPELNMLIPILGLNLLLMAMGRQHRTIMQKEFRFRAISIIELVSFFIALVVAVILAILDFGVYSLVYSTLAASLIANLLFLSNNLKSNPIRVYFRLSETRPFLRIGGYAMGSSLLDFFSKEIDIIIIGRMLGAESLGLYSLAKQIVIKLYSIVNPIIINVLSPVLSSLQTEKEKLKSYYLKSVNLLATINFPIYLLLAVLSKEILEVLYGSNYVEGYLVMGFLAISYATTSIGNPVGSLQIATGRTDLGLKWTVLRVLVTPVVIFYAATFNINVVAGTIAFLSFFLIIPLWRVQIKPMSDISLGNYINQFIRPYILFLIVIGLVFIFEVHFFYEIGLLKSVILKTFGAFFLYFSMLWIIEGRRISSFKILLSFVKKAKI